MKHGVGVIPGKIVRSIFIYKLHAAIGQYWAWALPLVYSSRRIKSVCIVKLRLHLVDFLTMEELD